MYLKITLLQQEWAKNYKVVYNEITLSSKPINDALWVFVSNCIFPASSIGFDAPTPQLLSGIIQCSSVAAAYSPTCKNDPS
jgi:hypothetical protein